MLKQGKFTAPNQINSICSENRPDIVAVDSPPYWGLEGNSRLVERALREKGIQSFATPSINDRQRQENRFYCWMKVGFAIFEKLAPSYPRYREGDLNHTAIEVFPHATAVFLAGSHRPDNLSKVCWRRMILENVGAKNLEKLSNADLVDAALAAITGIRALEGICSSFGDPMEGVIVVPVRNATTMELWRPI